MDQVYTHADFLRLAVTAFPDLAEEFEHIGEYWTLQIAAFGRRMQQAKGAADWDGYERGVRVITELWPRSDEHLSKALSFSLMKALDFEGPRGQFAWDLLPLDVQRAWRATRKSLDQLTALPKKAKKRAR